MWYHIEYNERDAEGYILNYAVENITFNTEQEVDDYLDYLKRTGCTEITCHRVN